MVAWTSLGIDIGGSKIAVGLVDDQGLVLRRGQAPTPASAGGPAIVRAVVELAREVLGDRQVTAVGAGAAGVIDRGRVVSATGLLSDWVGVELAAAIGTDLQAGGVRLPVAVVNDVHAHGVGEAWRGAGSGREWVLVIAIGTGLGGALIHHGLPVTGAHGATGHLGHIVSIDAGDLPCSCGASGHLEAIASGYGLVQSYRRLGGDPSVATAQQVSARIDIDSRAAEAVRRSATALGRGIGDLINIVDPDIVIISGSVSRAGESWWEQVRSAATAATLPLLSGVDIVPATLGADAGLVGAARLAFDAARKRS